MAKVTELRAKKAKSDNNDGSELTGHKENVKKKVRHNKNKKKSVSVARLPSKPEDFSSNWHRLQSQLQVEKKSSNKVHKKRKIKHEDDEQQLKRKKMVRTSSNNSSTSAKKGKEGKCGSGGGGGKSRATVDGLGSNDVWFEVNDPSLLKDLTHENVENENETMATNGNSGGPSESGRGASSFGPSMCDQRREGRRRLTKVLALDCEMVGVGFDGKQSVLARVSIVNVFGHCVMDKFVKPKEKVTDYRTEVSGIRPVDLKEKGECFEVVQRAVYEMISGRILVGHSLHHDLKVLMLSHPRSEIRDTAFYKPFRALFGNRTPSLKRLVLAKLGVEFQSGEHNSVEDARAVMALYNLAKKAWETELRDLAKIRRTFARPSVEAHGEREEQSKGSNDKMTFEGLAMPSKYVDSDSD